MANKKDLGDYRRDYESQSIGERDLDPDPIVQFGRWLQDAIDIGAVDATAMTLATATGDGIPSARIVLLKKFDDAGFCWFSDSRSQKGQELEANDQAALLFHWRDMSRQVRVQGRVERLPAEEAEAYFHSRPNGSRFSAAASHQSSPVENRAVLESEVRRLKELFPEGNVPRPESWIGYRLKPAYFEFWQGLVNRLHDRLIYRPHQDGWSIERISP
ncbi:MAG: pyridoxamine 5'-phosphate oxidase [Proteobacteria bacterium]|nr:pyridoxamine 5'-phosphate oxidase [Pseudomonadota bacterium]